MGNQAKFESEAIALLRHLKTKKEAMQERHALELAEIDKEIDAVSITVRLLREAETAAAAPSIIHAQSAIPNDLSGKTAREACIAIAKINNGVVRVGDAKKALVSARILKDTKNTWAIIYTTLHRSKEFEKSSGAGEFRLISPGQHMQGDLLQ